MSRYIPQDELLHLTNNLSLSRIESTRGYFNNNSHGELPSSEEPFNPILSYNVQYAEPRLSQINRVLTKYENHGADTFDIALYNTRSHALNAEDIPGLENNVLHRNQMERARSKIQQAHTDLLCHSNTDQFYNGNIYNPQLPISPTNQPNFNHPVQIDERLMWHTNDRPFKYASDIANDAYNNQRSPELIERNRRQAEADAALLGQHTNPRYVEAKMAYHDRPHDPQYDINSFVKHDASKSNDRQTGNIEKMTYNTQIRSKKVIPEESTNKVTNEVNQEFKPTYARHAIPNHMKNINDRRDPNSKINHFANEAFTTTNTKSNIIERFTDSVVSNVSNFISNIFKRSNLDNSNSRYQSSYDPSQEQTINDNSEISPFKAIKQQERFIYKPNHMLVIKDGNIRSTYPDENFDNTALVYVTKDAINTGLTRTIIIRDGAKYKIIQKHESDAIFTNDNRPYGEDYIMCEIPIENLNHTHRERIEKINLNTDRNKTLKLTYNDFVAFSDYVVNHPETTVRVKFTDLWKHIRGNELDEDLITSFDGRSTFVDESVIQLAQAQQRKENHAKLVSGRADKNTSNAIDYVDNYSTPFDSGKLPSSGESFRHFQQNDLLTQRTHGISMKRFNQ